MHATAQTTQRATSAERDACREAHDDTAQPASVFFNSPD